MKKANIEYLDFEIDKLTRSIENAITGDSFQTEFSNLTKRDLKHVLKKDGWLFDWGNELDYDSREVYKLTIQGNPDIIQGLVSISIESDHVYMHLVESAPFNRGKSKVYLGVPGNLVAFACRSSFDSGHEGNVAFHSKTKLIQHYEKTLEAFHFGGHLMIIETQGAKRLVEKYFKE